jgi:hypothetical protein
MANKKISQLTAKGAALAATDLIEISESNGAGGYVTKSITGANITGGGGGVTAVTATSPVVATGTTTPVVSLAAAYGDTLNPYASKTAKHILAAPNGAAGVPTFRAMVASDVPTLNQNTTGTAANVTGIVAVANGGTGTATPSLVAGTNVTITGTFPNQTIAASGGGGGTAGGPHLITQSGGYYGLKTNGTATTTCTTATNRMTLMPFVPNTDFIPGIGYAINFYLNVITASAVNCKFVVFSNSGGFPLTKLYDGITLSCATTGIKEEQSSFAGFTKGTTYWIGTITSGAGPTLTQYSIDSMIPISENVGGATNWFLSTTSYAYGSIPATVNPALFTPSTTNCPAVYTRILTAE